MEMFINMPTIHLNLRYFIYIIYMAMSIVDKEAIIKTFPSQHNNFLSNKLYYIPSPSFTAQNFHTRNQKSLSNAGNMLKKPLILANPINQIDYETVDIKLIELLNDLK